MTLEDADTLSLVLSDPESMTFYPHPFSREEVENWIKWNRDNYEKYGFGLSFTISQCFFRKFTLYCLYGRAIFADWHSGF